MRNTANKNPVVDTVSLKMTQSLTGLQPDRKLGMSLISTTNLQPFHIYNHSDPSCSAQVPYVQVSQIRAPYFYHTKIDNLLKTLNGRCSINIKY